MYTGMFDTPTTRTFHARKLFSQLSIPLLMLNFSKKNIINMSSKNIGI